MKAHWLYLRYVLGTLIFVWAFTIKAFCQIAIVAKHLIAVGEFVLAKPRVNARTAPSFECTPVGIATAIHVIDAEKLYCRFAATGTARLSIAVMTKYLIANVLSTLSLDVSHKFMLAFAPFSVVCGHARFAPRLHTSLVFTRELYGKVFSRFVSSATGAYSPILINERCSFVSHVSVLC